MTKSKRGATPPVEADTAAINQAQPSSNKPLTGSAVLKPCKSYIPHDQYNEIVEAISNDENHILNIFGLGGIGKSSLISKFVRTYADRVYYIDMSNAPHFCDVASRILFNVFEDKEVSSTDSDTILLDALQRHLSSWEKTIFIFDNLESIMEAGEQCGKIKSDYRSFDDYFKLFLQYEMASSLILSGREKVELSTNIDSGIEYIKLNGLNGTQTKQLLCNYGLIGNFDALCKKYSGNPLALKMAAAYIIEDFSKQIDDFLSSDELPDKVDELFQKHFDRLADIEKIFLLWLAVEREPMNKVALKSKIVLQAIPTQIINKTIGNMENRCLIEKMENSASWYLQGVILEFTSDYIKDEFVSEVQSKTPYYISRIGLIDTSSKEYIIETQKRLLVERIVAELTQSIGTDALKDNLREIANGIDNKRSYAAGNVINLFAALESILDGFCFASKSVISADLRYVSIHNSDFSNSTFEGVLLKNTYGALIDVRYSYDDRHILGAATEFSVDIWKADDLQFDSELSEHHDWVRSVDSNGKYIASGSNDEKVIVYDNSSLNRIYILNSHSTRVRRVRFSPLNDEILFSSDDDGKIIGINVMSKSECVLGVSVEEGVKETSTIWDFVFVNGGKQIVSVSDDKTVTIWDIENFENLEFGRILYTHSTSIKSVTWDGVDTVFCGCDDGELLEIDFKSGAVVQHNHFPSQIWSVDFCTKTNQLISSYDNGNVVLWDYSAEATERLTFRRALSAHKSKVWAANFNRSGNRFVTSSDDFQFKVWDATTYQVLHTMWGYTNLLRTISVSDENDAIIVAGDDAVIRRYRLSDQQLIGNYDHHNNHVRHLEWCSECGHFLSASDDGTVMYWKNCKVPVIYKGHTNRVWSVAKIGDGKFVSVGEEKDIYIWSVGNENPTILSGHSNWIWDVSYNKAKNLFATASEDRTCIIWKYCVETQKYKMLHVPFKNHKKWLFAVAFSQSGDHLVTCSADNTAIIYDVSTGDKLFHLPHDGWVWSAVFIDENTLVTGSADSKIRVYKLNYEIGEYDQVKIMDEHSAWVVSLDYSKKLNRLFSASADWTAKMWDGTTFDYIGDLHIVKPYDGINIKGIKGLSQAEISSLIKLGAKNN